MSATLTIRDEELSGKTIHELTLDFLTETITVRELLSSRVHQEVKDFNVRQNLQREHYALVQPTDAEKTLNGFRMKKPRQIDWKAQLEKAIEAFEKNQILILVNDRQMESLDDVIDVGVDTEVSFLKLTPLVGG